MSVIIGLVYNGKNGLLLTISAAILYLVTTKSSAIVGRSAFPSFSAIFGHKKSDKSLHKVHNVSMSTAKIEMKWIFQTSVGWSELG